MTDHNNNDFSEGGVYTEVTERSWFGRLGEAFKGILAGFILVGLSIFGLNMNEERAETREKSLDEGAAIVSSISSNSVDSANNGKLVHVSGRVETSDVLTDESFDISLSALRLRREVLVYQWEETVRTEREKQLGGDEVEVKRYYYDKVWRESLFNSNSFKDRSYQNPQNVAFSSGQFEAKNMTFGAFDFPRSLARKMDEMEKIPVESDAIIGQQDYGYVSFYNDGYYIGESPNHPQIGDMQVNFYAVEPALVSVIAQQVGNTFQKYSTNARGSLYLLAYGSESADSMFNEARKENDLWKWLGRLLGAVVMGIGISLIFKPIVILADFIPVLGYLVQGGFSVISFIISLVITTFIVVVS
ncbi:hypothetical protein EK599_22645 [Vibrio sp. T187]|uniref:TMEM43 family protein n=1 Tax=Vibrio TaxID=662 RepID=UPI0010C9982C|nr:MULTISPECIES: TMEM43 family protein [Vibrio]MBW3698480.1 hypothetical protein [Vibrio sp. T187]